MSRVIDAIEAKQGRRIALSEPPRHLTITDKFEDLRVVDAYKYSLKCVVEANVICTEKELPEQMTRAKQMIIQEIFGEFRDPLTKVYSALLERDTSAAMRALESLERQMFDVTLREG